MTDKTTFTNQTEIENEQEQLDEERRMTEEDTGYDKLEDEKVVGLTEQQLYNLREQNIKSLYSRLYGFGLTKDQIRSKLQKMSEFFGNIGSISDLSDEQMGAINSLIDQLQLINYKFR